MTWREEPTGCSDVHSSTAGRALASAARPRDPDLTGDEAKREALVQLRDRYVEAHKLVSAGEPYENLEWILGARRNPTQDPLGFQTETIELVALWLQDLALELDRRLSDPPLGGSGSGVVSTQEARQAVAQTLRDATERFLIAFRSVRSD